MDEDKGIADTIARHRAYRVGEHQGAYDAALRWLDEGRPDLTARALEDLLPHVGPAHEARVREAIEDFTMEYAVPAAMMERDYADGRRIEGDAGRDVVPPARPGKPEM